MSGRLVGTACALAATCAVAAAACQSATSLHTASNSSTSNPAAAASASPVDVAPAVRGAASAAPRSRLALSNGEVLYDGVALLPDRAHTPGAISAAVTQANIHHTICLTGYTKTVRPPSSYTTDLKRQQLDGGYAYHGDLALRDYEEDHLIPLEIGGNPSSRQNLWPEPRTVADGSSLKDQLENRLHDLVCSGQVALATVQQAVASNWYAAYQRYGGTGMPRVYDGAYSSTSTAGSTSTTTSDSGGTSGAAAGPTAQCRDGSYSFSQHRSGTCSGHGGVDHWINPPPS